MTLEDALRDRRKMLLLFRVGFWSSIALMAIGFYFIVRELIG